jgi:hypothetical protein
VGVGWACSAQLPPNSAASAHLKIFSKALKTNCNEVVINIIFEEMTYDSIFGTYL